MALIHEKIEKLKKRAESISAKIPDLPYLVRSNKALVESIEMTGDIIEVLEAIADQVGE